MALRNIEDLDLPHPPDGAFSMGLARHLTASWPNPDVTLLHRRRANLVHNFVDDLSLEVTDWGNVDAEHPSEIAELVVGIAAPLMAAAAEIIAAWITRPKPKPVDNEGLLGVKLKRPDGAELTLTYRSQESTKEIAQTIQTFLKGS